MNKAKPIATPMHSSSKLDKDQEGKTMDEIKYRGMIGSLMYLTSSRPDKSFSVGLCSRFQYDPRESHFMVVKKIFRCLLGTQMLGLWYPKTNMFELTGFCDADYASDRIDHGSTSGCCNLLGCSLVSWTSKK